MNKTDKRFIIKKSLIAVVFLVVMIFISIKYSSQLLYLLSNIEDFRRIILTYGHLGIFVLLGFQILQIVIPFIPGEVVQIAGGYIYGAPLSFVVLLIGTIIGGVIVFYLSRFIGYPLVKIFVSEEKMDKFKFLMKSKKAEGVLAALFLLPGIPKDTLIYLAGLTPIKPVRFFGILTVARIPGLFVSTFIGSNILEKNYTNIYVIAGSITAILLLGIIFRKRILKMVLEEKLDKDLDSL